MDADTNSGLQAPPVASPVATGTAVPGGGAAGAIAPPSDHVPAASQTSRPPRGA